jgi:hypothetical protein
VDDRLPADHFARFVIAIVEEMDLSAFYAQYRVDGQGRPAHDEAMMVALLVYAYARGQRSSRVIEPAAPPRISRLGRSDARSDRDAFGGLRAMRDTTVAFSVGCPLRGR